ncbi:MAG: hypothetical protein ACR2FI_10855 [Burkholderiales bacterium]
MKNEDMNSPFVRDDQEGESRFDREVNITRKEFLRQLPDAIGHLEFDTEGNQVIVKDGDKRARITVKDEGTDSMGALNTPMKAISFAFDGYSEEEIEAFMANYDENTMRFGGM